MPKTRTTYYQTIKERARQLRRNQTPAEKKIWQHLRKRQLANKKFIRQHPVVYNTFKNRPYFFIADFYCAEAELVIELDGGAHLHSEQHEYDKERDLVLKLLGLKVLRIKNEELEDIDIVLRKIKRFL